MIICGNAEEVEELQLKIKTGLLAIHEATVQLKQSLYGIKSKWQDEGYSEIESCIIQVMHLMTSYMDAFDELYALLEKYKSILLDKERNYSSTLYLQAGKFLAEKGALDSSQMDNMQKNESAPTPKEVLTAYMCAHNYGEYDYEVYSKDPEWKELHKTVFPEYHQISDYEFSLDEKIDWVCKLISNMERTVAKQVVTSMEYFSGMGYKTVHWDTEGKLSETKDILQIFDSGNVPSYKGRIYRGLSFGSKKEIVKVLKQSRGVWKEPGITSFSASKDIAREVFAKNDKWGLVLTCNNNKSAIPFRHISKLSWEDEVLSPGGHRNSGWKIDYNSIRIDEDERMVYVDIEEI